MRQETNLERRAVKAAAEAGFIARKVQYSGRVGSPDRWFFGENGNLLIVEFKDHHGSLSPAQKKEIAMLLRRGHPVWVIDNMEDFHAILRSDRAMETLIRENNIRALGSYYRDKGV